MSDDVSGPRKDICPSLEIRRSWGICPLFLLLLGHDFHPNNPHPTRTVQQGEVPGTALGWLLDRVRPAGLLCGTWRGDVFREDGSKLPRANCENSKAKNGFRWSGKYLGIKFPGILISCSILPLGALQNLTRVEVKHSAGYQPLSFFLMNAQWEIGLSSLDFLTYLPKLLKSSHWDKFTERPSCFCGGIKDTGMPSLQTNLVPSVRDHSWMAVPSNISGLRQEI